MKTDFDISTVLITNCAYKELRRSPKILGSHKDLGSPTNYVTEANPLPPLFVLSKLLTAPKMIHVSKLSNFYGSK